MFDDCNIASVQRAPDEKGNRCLIAGALAMAKAEPSSRDPVQTGSEKGDAVKKETQFISASSLGGLAGGPCA